MASFIRKSDYGYSVLSKHRTLGVFPNLYSFKNKLAVKKHEANTVSGNYR